LDGINICACTAKTLNFEEEILNPKNSKKQSSKNFPYKKLFPGLVGLITCGFGMNFHNNRIKTK
jgi:hypothetical protein